MKDNLKRRYAFKPHHLITILFLLFIAFFSLTNISLLARCARSARSVVRNGGRNITSEIAALSTQYDDNFHLKYAFLDLNGLVHKLLGKRTMNSVTKLDNGYLASPITSGGTMERQSRMMIDLYDHLKEKRIPMLYVQAPGKIGKYDRQLPEGITDRSNENIDHFLNGMKSGNIPVLDIREEIAEDNLDHYSLFFRTDHHWTPEGGFFAYGQIMEKLESDFDYDVDSKKLDSDNYSQEHYYDHFLGSTGRRTGTIYAGVDDISLIYPDFETDLSLHVPERDISRTGSFRDVIFDYTHVETKDYYNFSPYSTYIGGDYPLVIHENREAENEKTVLLVRDSFSLPVQSFLSLSISDLHVLDLRYYNDQSLLEYVDELQPDLIMFLYNVNIFGDDSMFQFGMD